MLSSKICIVILALTVVCFSNAYGQHIYPQDADRYSSQIPGEQAIGRWDMTIYTKDGQRGSWLEIEKYGSLPLYGKLRISSTPQPITKINYSEESKTYNFTIPPHIHVEFKLESKDKLSGWITYLKGGQKERFVAVRAQELKRPSPLEWGKPIHLLENGFSAWKPANSGKNLKGWIFKNGVLIKNAGGPNIITKQKFNNFKLHVEFRYANHSNSGIYLRGRYEVQVLDSYGAHPESHQLGGIYGFITPTVNAAKKPVNGRLLILR